MPGFSVVGLDLSLVATGWADHRGTQTYKPKSTGVTRLIDIEQWVLAEADERDLANLLIVVEGASFHSKGRALDQIYGLGWVVRVALVRAGIVYVDVPPASLKKWATGKGTSGKDEMLLAAVRRHSFEGTNNNEADAWLLRAMALSHYGREAQTEYQREALVKVEWPDLGEW